MSSTGTVTHKSSMISTSKGQGKLTSNHHKEINMKEYKEKVITVITDGNLCGPACKYYFMGIMSEDDSCQKWNKPIIGGKRIKQCMKQYKD